MGDFHIWDSIVIAWDTESEFSAKTVRDKCVQQTNRQHILDSDNSSGGPDGGVQNIINIFTSPSPSLPLILDELACENLDLFLNSPSIVRVIKNIVQLRVIND